MDRPDRFVAGDPLRAIAALAVLIYHVGLTVVVAHGGNFSAQGFSGTFGGPDGRMIEGGRLGIFLFFVLSGYLISRPFVAAYVGKRSLPPIPQYLRNRALRIIPLFWLVATVVLIHESEKGGSPLELLAIYGFNQNLVDGPDAVFTTLAPAWTLHCEVGFYLLVPLVALALGRLTPDSVGERGRLAVVVGIGLVLFAASVGLRDSAGPGVKELRTLAVNFFAFVPGVLLAAFEPRARSFLRERQTLTRLLAPALVAATAGAFAAHQFLDPGETAGKALLIALLAAGLVAAPLVLQWAGRPAWRLLDNVVMQRLGAWSYSLYLVQVPLLVEIDSIASGDRGVRVEFVLLLAAALALVTAVSALTYRFVERPFLQRRKPTAIPSPAPPSESRAVA